VPTDFRITVQGHLDQHWSAWFEGLTINNGKDGQTVLAGRLADQAALFGVLAKIRDLGLPMIAVVPAHTDTGERAGAPCAAPAPAHRGTES
jgi:hypothetical protein